MTNVIDLTSRRHMPAIIRIVKFVLSEGKEITIGSSDVPRRYRELEFWFPEAKLEIVDMGVKICNRQS